MTKKKNILHYITQFTGVVIVKLPATMRWISSEPDKLSYILELFFFDILFQFLVNLLFIHLFNFLLRKKYNFIVISFISIGLIISSPVLYSLITMPLKSLIWGIDSYALNWDLFSKSTLSNFLGYSFYILIYFVTYYWLEFNKQKEKALKAISLANEAQLEMLQYQVNPHFLFNSLNTIQSMIEIDKERAKEMIADLSDFFRHTLSGKNQIFISLKEEMNAVDKYLSIQKERFREKLLINIDVDKNVYDIEIPAFIIHPLIENAIKYGFSQRNNVLSLSIVIKLHSKDLIISVINSGNFIRTEDLKVEKISSTKTGIENIKKRLSLLYPNKYEFTLTEENDFVTAKIVIKDIK